eukprot:TRINITY_DN20171_c0_g1_i1.p1 TRINITY_DN20171_c0_g1~~TRINITY_DN20171_c0_g1_i1.p1  ORF type:complete len:230 (-),score=52.04 TRINITY_DN20171_c0_g1_i1:60-749(-)
MKEEVSTTLANEALSAFVKAPISTAERDKLKIEFDKVDADKNGSIDDSELQAAIKEDLGEFSIPTIRAMIACFDTEKKGSVTLDQFIYLYRFVAALAKLFADTDTDKSGTINAKEVHALLKKEGVPSVDETLVANLVGSLDPAGELSLDSFISLRLIVGSLRASFDKADKDKSGSIEITEAVTSVSGEETSGDILETFKEFDKNGDGKLDWAEFLELGFTFVFLSLSDV